MIKWDTLKTSDDLLDEYKQSKLPEINRIRDEVIAGGIEYQGNVYQTRERDVADMMGALQVAQLAATQGQQFMTKWLTEANVEVDLDLSLLSGLGVAVAEHKKNAVYKARQHKDNILALTSKQAVDDYMANLSWE